ncbi:hypothetical protein M422DRAFT_274299 [Sphaerobolus stellatus SS14]|uniref:DDE-1 domain-containing protein n=1 Tax=Sphaerobolus stellatus (strain SS14) TaxID=990650 RepID=A0A0C9TSK4_SPHS4|nr:hypothetical protein M422DRAFT_274299 [Sphaerobolus stellatus SS14]
MEVEEIEDEDAPGACFHSSPDEYVDLNVDPDTGVECWEEELHETRAHPTEIHGWAELRGQINDDLKKKFKTFTPSQVNQLIILRSFATLRLRSVGKLKASEQIALQWQDDVNGSAAHFARRIRALASHYQVNEQLPIEKRGGYKNAHSILKEGSVHTAARAWLTSQKVGSITPTKFCNGLNTEILPGLGISLKSPFCTKTALRWLVKLGWMKTTLKKGVYMDGHERKDVINYRQMVYLPKIAEYQNQMAKYKGPELKKIEPNLKDGEKEIIAVFQDESCCHANEFQTTAWMRPGVDQILQRKGRGRLIHISDFILESTDGSVKCEACKIIYPGSGGDPYWDKNQLLAQVKNAAIPVFEEANPGKQALFIFDQSSAHAALPDNALRAFEMNKSNGGAQRTQRDTVIPMTNKYPEYRMKPQSMTTLNTDGKWVPKGLQQVLEERGFNVTHMRAKCQPVCPFENHDCCMACLLSHQDDFVNQTSELEQIIVDAGHLCLFLPKFHCELNPIEMTTFGQAKAAAIQCLDACPVDVIRRFINRSWRFTAAYQGGLTGKAAAWAVRKFKSHHTISNAALISLEALVQPHSDA